MRATIHHWEVQLLHQLQYLAALVVLSIIEADEGVLPSSSVLLVELPHKISEEQAEDSSVSIGLGESNVALPMVVEGEDHTDARLPEPLRDGISASWGLPLGPPKVLHSKPGLIYVDDSATLLELA